MAKPDNFRSVVTAAPAREDGSADYFVYLLGTGVRSESDMGLTGFQIGIDYQNAGPGDGLVVSSWRSCGTLEFPTQGWPARGTGNTITWPTTDCRRDVLVSAGYFYVTAYSPAAMSIVGYPTTGKVKVADCEGAEVEREVGSDQLGWASFGGAASGQDVDGCNPAVESCERPVPVKPVSWGRIKSMYGR
jgi:hypothetical protein